MLGVRIGADERTEVDARPSVARRRQNIVTCANSSIAHNQPRSTHSSGWRQLRERFRSVGPPAIFRSDPPCCRIGVGAVEDNAELRGNDLLVVITVADGEHSRIFELHQTEGEVKQAAGNQGPGGGLSPPGRRGSTQAGSLRLPVNPSVSHRTTGSPFQAVSLPME